MYFLDDRSETICKISQSLKRICMAKFRITQDRNTALRDGNRFSFDCMLMVFVTMLKPHSTRHIVISCVVLL
jgi:hypothetical protein